MMSKTTVVCVCTALVLALTCAGAGAATWHVDDDAAGGDGRTWGNAFNDLQDALTAATSGDEIWVAKGLYIPGSARSATFQLIDGVTIYGGFPDGGGTMGDRNMELYKTTLSGDLLDDDIPHSPFVNNDENAYHVVTGSGTDGTAILDGFTITGGNANGSTIDTSSGGGIYFTSGDVPAINSGEAIIRNCTFKLNQAHRGGGALVHRGSPTFERCTFLHNRAFQYGGGFCVTGNENNTNQGRSVLRECRFVENTSTRWQEDPPSANSAPQYINCAFIGNTVTGTRAGAALSNR